MSESTKVASGAFKSLLGLDATKYSDTSKQPDNFSLVRRFSTSEISSFTKQLYVAPETRKFNATSAAGIISYLKPIHAEIGNKASEVGMMRALAPEIEQSRILVSSSIVSPNDLQDGEFIFSFDKIPSIGSDPELASEIAEVYNEMYNKTLDLGIKSYDWIGEIQYESGAKPILILPIATHAQVRNHDTENPSGKSLIDFGPGLANYGHREILNHEDFFWSEKPITWKEALSGDISDDVENIIPAMESFGIFELKKENSRNKINEVRKKDVIPGLESMIVNLRKKLEEGDVIKVSENPEILRMNTVKKLKNKNDVYNKFNQGTEYKRPRIQEFVQLDTQPEGYQHVGHPTIIELPVESVIPVHIPGAPKEHIGYFILLDKFGQPLTIDASGMTNDATKCNIGSSNEAYDTLFGTGCCTNKIFGKDISNSGNIVFQHLFDKYVKARMKGIFGRDDLEINRFNAVSTVLFYRLLEQKQTQLVFVPPTLLHYFAFDYRKNGTGKSKIEDIQFLLSLRTTLMMANVVAMVNDAVEHKRVEFGVDEKLASLETVMDMIAQIFIAKNKLNGSIDPSEIMRDMYANALTIVPKSIPGLTELSVDVQNSGGQSTRPDDALIEQLNNLLVSQLDVPPAALNQMGEPEFSRSLVTYNLFFAKKIARYQRIWCQMIGEFIKAHSHFDIHFQEAIKKKLQVHGKKHAKEDHPEAVKKLIAKNPNQYTDDMDKLLEDILDNVSVSLPTPNIVVDKTQFEEIRQFTSSLDEIADRLFNQEAIPSEDQLAQMSLPIVKAKWKRDQLMRFIERVGSFNMIEIPNLDDIDPSELTDFIQVLQNAGSAINQQREKIGTPVSENSGGFGSDSGFGGGYDSGGGDTFGGDDGFGSEESGGDFGEDMGGENMDMGSEAEEPSENTEETSEESSNETTASMYANLYKKP